MSYKTTVRKHNTVYKITNQINQKYYYGIHSTDNLNDSYFGGGLKLRDAIKKYGKENFVKEIIADYPTRKEASDHERILVTQELVESDQCYNIRTGGDNEVTMCKESAQRISIALKGRKQSDELIAKRVASRKVTQAKKTPEERSAPYIGVNLGRKMSDAQKELLSKIHTGRKMSDETKQKMRDYYEEFGYNMTGKHHSESTIQQIIETKSDRGLLTKYEIFGKVYFSIGEAAKDLDVQPFQVRFRAKSKIKKWKDWSIAGEENREFALSHYDVKYSIDGIIYNTLKEASLSLNTIGETLRYRLHSNKDKWSNYKIITDG